MEHDHSVEPLPEGDELSLPVMTEDRVEFVDHPIEVPHIQMLQLEQIHQAANMRTTLNRVDELAESIRHNGLLHPVRVVRADDDASHGKGYELVFGYRRVAALARIGSEQVPAMIEDAADDASVLVARITENLQRDNPSPIDEAREMQRMIDVFGWTQAQVADKLGVHRTQVTKRLGLLSLPEKVRDWVSEGKLTASAAEVVSRMDSEADQEELAELAVRTEAPVAKLNAYASKIKEEKTKAEEEDLAPAAEEALDRVEQDDMVDLPHLALKEDLNESEWARAGLYALLFSGNDREAQEYLRNTHGIERSGWWRWASSLNEDEVASQYRILLSRWLAAPHRFPTLSFDLRSELGSGTVTGSPLMGEPDLAGPDNEDWQEDEGDWDWEADSSSENDPF